MGKRGPNLPKSNEWCIDQLRENGASLDDVIALWEGREPEPAEAGQFELEVPKIEEIKPEDMEYSCGNCHNNLTGPVQKCPFCGSGLRWG